MRMIMDGGTGAIATILLAHGAGAGSQSPGMAAIASALVRAGFRVARFDFAYMAARLEGLGRPPPKAEALLGEYREAVAMLNETGPLIIGGKSMGGRVASMVAGELFASGRTSALLCIGYPFHPPTQPDRPRIAHLTSLAAPMLICQGTRDPFGGHDEVASYGLSEKIELLWLEDGDHELRPRKRLTGLSHDDHLRSMAQATRRWAERILL